MVLGKWFEKHNYLSLSLRKVHFIAQIKRLKNEGILGTQIPHHRRKKGAHMLLAPSQTNALHLYYLWAALLPKDSCGHETADKHTKQASFSSGPDTDYRCHETWNLITSTLSFDAMSCLQSSADTWLRHLCSAGLSGNGNSAIDERVGGTYLGEHIRSLLILIRSYRSKTLLLDMF